MKIYLFFEIGNRVRKYDEPRLYAWTYNKKIAERFKEERDMEKIFRLKIKSVNKNNGLRDFEDRYSKYRLVNIGFYTKKLNDDGVFIKESIKLVGTMKEEDSIILGGDELFNREISKYINIYTEALKPKYLESLNFFKYFHYSVSLRKVTSYDFYAGIIENVESGIDPFPEIDELSMFLYFYGYTMKLK